MSKTDLPPERDAAPASISPGGRQDQGRRAEDGAAGRVQGTGSDADPHPIWLRNWRSLRAGFDGRHASRAQDEKARELQNSIAHTPARTLAGLQAQAELISELAWNDVVASTARELLKGIKRLRRSNSERS